MSDKRVIQLQGVSETLLIPLYVRAKESQRADAIMRDEQAASMIQRIDYDFSKFHIRQHDETLIVIRNREFDRFVCDFLLANPDGKVVHIGCGLDTRFTRVDNGKVEWYDLDMPAVIELRHELLADTCPRYHMIAGSVFEDSWLEAVSWDEPRPVLFVAEGVLPYFPENQVRTLVRTLGTCFSPAEMVFDGTTPLMVSLDNIHLILWKVRARLHWKMRSPRILEEWNPHAKLLEAWYYFERREPRLKSMMWMQHFPPLGKGAGIFHYRLR